MAFMSPPPGASDASFHPDFGKYKAITVRLFVRGSQNASGDWETTETDITMAQPSVRPGLRAPERSAGATSPGRRGTAMEHGAIRPEDARSAAIAGKDV